MADTTGMADLRAENVERIVKGFALQEYRFKDLCMISTSSANSESYYQETATDLTGGTGSAVKGVPRLAGFPAGEVSFTKQTSYNEKYAMEGVISWEDKITNNVDVIARTLLRVARAVTKAVDAQIWAIVADGPAATPSNINYVTIAASNEWDSATVANRDPISDILHAKAEIYGYNYDPDRNGFIALSPKDYAHLLMNSKVVNNPTFKTADVVSNGRVGRICGLDIIVSNSVTADYALVGIKKECATWKQVNPLTVVTIEDPGVKYTVRAWEIGCCQLTNPRALCLIVNTQA